MRVFHCVVRRGPILSEAYGNNAGALHQQLGWETDTADGRTEMATNTANDLRPKQCFDCVHCGMKTTNILLVVDQSRSSGEGRASVHNSHCRISVVTSVFNYSIEGRSLSRFVTTRHGLLGKVRKRQM